jgi:hypothetical protein
MSDDKVVEIETYMAQLLHSTEWTEHSKGDGVVVRSLNVQARQGSKFSSDLPVTYVLLELSGNIAPGFILNFLNDPPTRLKWDNNYKEMQIVVRRSGWDFITRIVMDMKFSLMQNREFVERKVIKQEDNCTNVIFYSCEHKATSMQAVPLSNKLVRGYTAFGFHQIVKKQTCTELHLVCQSDMKMPFVGRSAGIVVSRLGTWAKELKARLELGVV